MDAKEQWEVLTEVYNQDEMQLIGGLLNMAGIPIKIDRDATGDLYGLTIGPLARIQIMVPAHLKEAAEKVLAGEIEDLESEDEL